MDLDDIRTEQGVPNIHGTSSALTDQSLGIATNITQTLDQNSAPTEVLPRVDAAENVHSNSETHDLDAMEIDEPDTSSVSDPETVVHMPTEHPTYEPTQEEIDAAALFDEHNREEEGPAPPMDAQFLADLEMAQVLQALENGAGYEFNIPDHDQDVAPEIFDCVCGDSFTYTLIFEGKAVLLPCIHARCISCLNENVRVGLESRRNFPPRCCGAIDVNDIAHYLTEDVLARWAEVQVEYEDIAPVYCAVKECSRYLTKDALVEGAKWALCQNCDQRTCTGCLCLESAHEAGSDQCPERMDKMDKDLMQKKGWKPCPHCGHMVERTEGCDHMTCDCGQDFCYACGAKYRGGMPCNCYGQREWVNDDPNANDEQAQQQILDNIAHPDADQHEDGDSDEDEDDEDENMDDEQQENNVETAATQDTEPLVNAQPNPVTDSDAITEFVTRLRATRPDLAAILDTLITPNQPLLPQRLPGVAAELRRITGLSGEDFRAQLDEVRTELSELAIAPTNPDIVVIAAGEPVAAGP